MNVFALVWKQGRLGVKIPDESKFKTLLAKEGAEPWKAGDRVISQWILLPVPFHHNTAALKKYVTLAHRLAILSLHEASLKSTQKKTPKKTTQGK